MAELFRYAAFISYSSKDAPFARRLHRALESYGIPSSLGKFDLIGGGKKNRIYPVFRDREELAAGDLGEAIVAALRASRALIVVCSPDSAASPWVQKEIEHFASLGRPNSIFAIIPDSAQLADESIAASCFPPALQGGLLQGVSGEPLAADARKGKDGFRNAWLKLVAGMIGVTPGQLMNRDKARARTQTLQMLLIVVGVLAAVGMGGSRMIATQLEARSLTLAELARAASNQGFYDRAARYAREGMAGADLPLLGYNAEASEIELRRALTGPARAIITWRRDGDVGRTFSPDGKVFLLTRDRDNTVLLRDVSSGSDRVLRGHRAPIYNSSFSPDGSLVFTASRDGTARIWDVARAAAVSVIHGYDSNVSSASFSPDGKLLAIVTEDNSSPIVWTVTSGRQVSVLRGHDSVRFGAQVYSASFSRDGARIVTGGRDMTARVWDAASGRELAVLRPPPDPQSQNPVQLFSGVRTAFFSPDGRRVLTLDSTHHARVWDVASERELGSFDAQAPAYPGRQAASFSPDGALAIAVDREDVVIWDVSLGQEIGVLGGHEDWIETVAFSPDGRRIVTASQDTTARIWEIRSIIDFDAEHRRNPSLPLELTNDGTRHISADTHAIAVLRGHEGSIESALFSSDGTRILTLARDQTARVWELSDQPIVLRPAGGAADRAAISPDGQRVVTVSFDENVARVLDVRSQTEITSLRGHTRNPIAASFSSDGTRIVTASKDQTARVWDAVSGRQLALLRGHTDLVTDARFDIRGERIVTVGSDGTVRTWNAITGAPLLVIRIPSAPVNGVGVGSEIHAATFSQDGTRILTLAAAFSRDDRPVRQWDASSGREFPSAALDQFPDSNLAGAAFSPDGQYVVVSDGQFPRLWDVASGRELVHLRPGGEVRERRPMDMLAEMFVPAPTRASVAAVSFSPDGRRVVAAEGNLLGDSSANVARVWDVGTGRELAVLRGHDLSVNDASFSEDGRFIVTASYDGTARVWRLPRSLSLSRLELLDAACDGLLTNGGGQFTEQEFREAPSLNAAFDHDACEATNPFALAFSYLSGGAQRP